MNDTKTYTVAEAAALPDGWLNGTLEAHCVKIETVPKKAGGNFYKAHLSDGEPESLATMSLFIAPKFHAGDIIRLSGSGIKKGEFQGKAQFSTGKDTKIDVSPGKQRVQAAAHSALAEQANGELVSGQQAGMAIKEAIHLYTIGHSGKMQDLLNSTGFWSGVYETASDIVRVARMVEKGKLADPVRARQRQPGHQPPHHESNVDRELDEDVPF